MGTEHEGLVIRAQLEGVPGDIRWEMGPDGTPLPSIGGTTWPGVDWEGLRADEEGPVARGTLSGSREETGFVDLPDPGTYVVSVEPIDDQGEAGYSVKVWEARLHPHDMDLMYLAFGSAWFVFGTITILSVLYWNRKFPDEYRWTKYLALAYAVMSGVTAYLLWPALLEWPT